jgi:CheY-like chemotaxis protein
MRQGSKIGLAVCQRLVENMGGKIGVARTADNGTRAWISVPLAESELLPGTQATNQNGLKGQSAIVISGNRTLDRIIRRYLEAWGMSCAIAADISSASTLLRKDHERKFSVAIVDTNLIESSGPLITSQIQERVALADLPLVLLRTITEALETDSAPSSDKVRFVTKPLLPREFRNSLLKIIGSESIRTEHKEESGRLRILIAEDNTANGHMLIAMLRSLGCDPDYVENGREALEILAREPYDLVLMDFEMPGLDGDQVTREVRTNRGLYASQPVIIAVTATNSVEHRRRCLDAGMDGFIAKPIRLEKLKQGLLEWPLLAKVDQVSDVDNSGQITAGTDVPEFRLTEQLYRRIGQGSPEIRHNYIDLFLGDSLKRIEDLHLALRSKDTEVLSRQSHALKGACLEIGHLRMSQHCDHLRAASEQGRLDDAAVVVDEIDKEFTQLRNILEAEKMKDNQDTANPAR